MFDACLMVDWSARAKPAPPYPSEDAIWLNVRNPRSCPSVMSVRSSSISVIDASSVNSTSVLVLNLSP